MGILGNEIKPKTVDKTIAYATPGLTKKMQSKYILIRFFKIICKK